MAIIHAFKPETEEVTVLIKEKKVVREDWVVVKLMFFPYIWIVWLGGVLMNLGFLVSIVGETKQSADRSKSTRVEIFKQGTA